MLESLLHVCARGGGLPSTIGFVWEVSVQAKQIPTWLRTGWLGYAVGF